MLCRREMESQRGQKGNNMRYRETDLKENLNLHNVFLRIRGKGYLLCCCCFSCWDFAPFEIRMFFEIMLIHRQYGLEVVFCKVLLNSLISYAKYANWHCQSRLCVLYGIHKEKETLKIQIFLICNSKDLNECMTRKLMRGIKVETFLIDSQCAAFARTFMFINFLSFCHIFQSLQFLNIAAPLTVLKGCELINQIDTFNWD